MENEATTKTPIPLHRESLSCLLSPVFCPTRPSCPACSRSTLVETPLQIHLFFAKQSQLQNGQYEHKYSKHKGLYQKTTNNDQRTPFKTNPIKPNSPAPRERPLQFPSQPEQAARPGNQAPNNQKSRRIPEQTDHQQSKLLIEPLQKKKSWLSDVFALE